MLATIVLDEIMLNTFFLCKYFIMNTVAYYNVLYSLSECFLSL